MSIEITFTPAGNNGSGVVAAQCDGEVVATDRFDVCKSAARQRFAEQVARARPGILRITVEQELLRLASQITRPEPSANTAGAELDMSRIVRPELFHTRDVSGMAIPTTRLCGGKPKGSWELYLRWHADGRRERRDLEPSIELPGGSRLWLHPLPGEPEPTTRSGWSVCSREAWLAGADCPDPEELWKGIAERLTYFLDFPPDAGAGIVATLASWVMLSYLYAVWPSVPYLAVGGPQASGKTTLFRVLARLVFRPIESSNMTAPCLFRTLHERGGVLLLDEAERLRDGTPDAGELRSILLSGSKAGSPAMRLEKVGDAFRRTEFDCYGPKALACIGSLPEALSSRCIRIAMFRTAADSPKPRRRLDEDPATWQKVRDALHVLALEHGNTWIKLPGLVGAAPADCGGRDFELWQPLAAIASWLTDRGAEGLLALVKRHAAAVIESSHDDNVPEMDEILLRIVAERVLEGTQRRLKAGDVLRLAREVDGVTFSRWTSRGVGATLARYGLRTHKASGSRSYDRVRLADLMTIERAYGFDLGLPADENAAAATPSGSQPMTSGGT